MTIFFRRTLILKQTQNLNGKQKQLTAKILLCFLLTSFLFDISEAQTVENIKLLKQKIDLADSVVLISHEVTAEYEVTKPPDWDRRDTSMNLEKWYKLNPPLLKFLDKGKLNRKIIKESLSLNDSNKVILSNILLRRVFIKNYTPTTCDEPRHSIIIYKNNKQSYIDICFGCDRIHTSKDIYFAEFYMDEKKWDDLKQFYKTNGLTEVFKENEQ